MATSPGQPDAAAAEAAAPATAGRDDDQACGRAWTALTAAHARIAGQLSGALAAACGLGLNDFEILLRLDRAGPRGLRLGSIGLAVPLTQPSLSRAAARLADRGWLSRAGAADDRRGVLVTLTPAGRDVLRQAIAVHARAIREFLPGPLTPDELELLCTALSSIAGP